MLNNCFQIDKIHNVALAGLTNELFSVYVNQIWNHHDKSILIVTPSLYEANQIYESLSNYNSCVSLFPMDDFFSF